MYDMLLITRTGRNNMSIQSRPQNYRGQFLVEISITRHICRTYKVHVPFGLMKSRSISDRYKLLYGLFASKRVLQTPTQRSKLPSERNKVLHKYYILAGVPHCYTVLVIGFLLTTLSYSTFIKGSGRC